MNAVRSDSLALSQQIGAPYFPNPARFVQKGHFRLAEHEVNVLRSMSSEGLASDVTRDLSTSQSEVTSMREEGAYGDRLAKAFKQHDVPTLVTRALRKSTLAVTELRCDEFNFGRTDPIPREDAYLVALQLRACEDHDLYIDDRLVRPTNWGAGTSTIFDLRRNPIADIRDPSHCLMFYLPQTALDQIAAEAGVPRVGDLRVPVGVGLDDPVVRHLLCSLLPATANPGEANALFMDHVALALTAHVAQVYGGMRERRSLPQGGLAPWQERRAKELMVHCLAEDVPLGRLAAECKLSIRHFSRAFRRTTGEAPHRWLLKRRVERACKLLSDHAMPLADIALACGFADQSHFTRVFSAMLGVSPGAWRRANRRL